MDLEMLEEQMVSKGKIRRGLVKKTMEVGFFDKEKFEWGGSNEAWKYDILIGKISKGLDLKSHGAKIF